MWRERRGLDSGEPDTRRLSGRRVGGATGRRGGFLAVCGRCDSF